MASRVADPRERFSAPWISVVIPCFDQPDEHLRECLESVRDQTLPHWEAIVVDDSSVRGDVIKVVAWFDDPRIRAVTHRRNRGLGAARNSGYRAARAELVALVDSDDRLTPSFLEETHRALAEVPSAGWAFTDVPRSSSSPVSTAPRLRRLRRIGASASVGGGGRLHGGSSDERGGGLGLLDHGQ